MWNDLDTVIPSDEDIAAVEEALGFAFPGSYTNYVRSGGLANLRVRHRVLAPAEIIEALQYIPDKSLVPFADNGCGDNYCWIRSEGPEPAVLFWDHESQSVLAGAPSFGDWLAANRF
ncbi:SMI1/KNR4 family protein [Lysobacter korlensis]|uniref:SMI1/KNR4 family protein n=1 Tax=Lysobacter korlensis TaxID=553636 RepID=A0ABV6S110_9GAMM